MSFVGRRGFLLAACLSFGLGIAVATATGLWLSFRYYPAGPADGVGFAPPGPDGWVDGLHVAAAWVTVAAAGAIVVSLAARRWRDRRGGGAAAAMAAAVVALLVGVASGRRLPWSQVGLWAVTVGHRFQGVWFVAGKDARFALTPQGQVGRSTYRRWLLLHVGAVPVAVAVAVASAVLLHRRARAHRPSEVLGVDAS